MKSSTSYKQYHIHDNPTCGHKCNSIYLHYFLFSLLGMKINITVFFNNRSILITVYECKKYSRKKDELKNMFQNLIPILLTELS